MSWADRFRRKPITAAIVADVSGSQTGNPTPEAREVTEAWEFWRRIPEIHYSTSQQARLVGRLDTTMSINGGEAMEPDSVDAILTAAFGKNMRDLSVNAALNLQVAGGYVLARTRPNDPESCRVISYPPNAQDKKLLDGADIKIMVRTEDPRDSRRNDSPLLANSDVCRELILARAQGRAQSRNRTAQHGLLIYASEAFANSKITPESLMDVITAPLADERSAASVTPNMLGVPSEYVKDGFKTLDLGGDYDDKLYERIERLVHTIAIGMDFPPEILEGMGDVNHWCRPVGTLAYTRSGWSVPEVGDEIMTTDGWAPVTVLYQADASGDTGLRVTVCNTHGGPHSYSIDATEGHRFYVERDGERLLTTTPQVADLIYRGLSQVDDLSQFPVYRDSFAELLAWYSSDGTLTGTEAKPGQIRIGKNGNWPHLERVLTDTWGPSSESMPLGAGKPMWRMEVRTDGLRLAVLNREARNEILAVVPTKSKAIPLDFVRQLTAEQLAKFLDAWAFADGHRIGAAAMQIEQRNPDRLAAPEYAAIMLGYGVQRTVVENRGGFAQVGPVSVLYITAQQVRVTDVQTFEMDTAVWCPTTEVGTWLAYDPASGWTDYTGNSSWAISEDNWLGHVEPMAAPIWRGYAEFLDIATGESFELFPDPQPLLQRRPLTIDALAAYEARVVGGRWTREQLGATEADAPSPEELERMDEQAERKNAPASEVIDGTVPRAVAEPAGGASPTAVAAALVGRVPTVSLVPPVVAAGHRIHGRTLNAIDQQAYDALSDLVNDTTDRTLERLGAKVRSMSRTAGIDLPAEKTNVELAIAFTGQIPNSDVTISDTVSSSLPKLDRIFDRAFARLRSEGVDLSVDHDDQQSARSLYSVLVANVITLRMDGKTADAETWQASRRVTAVAGGNGDPFAVTAAAGVKVTGLGIALGQRSLAQITQVFNLVPGSYTWLHEYSGKDAHPQHEQFSGREFNGDFILEDGTNWFPGDHAGCQCAGIINFVEAS